MERIEIGEYLKRVPSEIFGENARVKWKKL
jgi:hypothetical protein